MDDDYGGHYLRPEAPVCIGDFLKGSRETSNGSARHLPRVARQARLQDDNQSVEGDDANEDLEEDADEVESLLVQVASRGGGGAKGGSRASRRASEQQEKGPRTAVAKSPAATQVFKKAGQGYALLKLEKDAIVSRA